MTIDYRHLRGDNLSMMVQTIKTLPQDFLILENESKAEGFKFLEKMRFEWEYSKNRFDKPGEELYAIFDTNKLVAVGGINRDPYVEDESVGRLRHLYVLKDFRKQGYGAALVNKILENGLQHFSRVRLRTDTYAASKFYERLGFTTVNDVSASHQWVFDRKN